VTPHAGVALLVGLGRISGVMGAAEEHLPAKKNPRGLGQGQMVESFVPLGPLGECADDFENPGGTAGWKRSWGTTSRRHPRGDNGWSGASTMRA
jgi:hypothetical protein